MVRNFFFIYSLLFTLLFVGLWSSSISLASEPQNISPEMRYEMQKIFNKLEQKIFSWHHTGKVFLNDKKKFRAYTFTPQFVGLAFDGSYSLKMWEQTRAFAKEMNELGSPVRFSYYVSGVYFIPENLTQIYDLDGYKTGHSDIGWGDDAEDITKRINQVNSAYLEGHEIGSHANGHFDGSKWSKELWTQEFDYFSRFLFPRFDNKYPELDKFHSQIPRFIFEEERVHGFRAPLLGNNNAMYEVMEQFDFTYDTNKVYPQQRQPKKGLFGIWELPLYGITVNGRNTISMDYNLYYLQTEAKSILKKGTAQWDKAHADALKGYMDLFNNHYYNQKAPVLIGHHFSTWNDELYWEVMKSFAREVCGKPEVICSTHEEIAWWLKKMKN